MVGTAPHPIYPFLYTLKGLNLIGNDLTGTIPTELAQLTALESLLLWGNSQLQKPVPEDVCMNTLVGDAGVRTPWCGRQGSVRCCAEAGNP